MLVKVVEKSMDLSTEMNVLRPANPRSVDEIPLVTVHDYLLQRVRKWLEDHEDYVWLEDVISGQRILLSEVETLVLKVSSGLSKRGFGRGDVLCVYANNFPHFFIPVLAAWQCGGCVTTSNIMSTTGQLAGQFNDCKVKVLVCDTQTLPKALEAVGKCPSIKLILLLDGPKIAPEGIIPLTDLLRDDGKSCPSSENLNIKEDLVFLVYSSGTTGLPKGVMHTHFTLMACLTQYKVASSPDVVLLITNCFFHVSGFLVCLNWLGTGVHIHTLSCYADETLLKTIQNKKPSTLLLYPHQVTMLSKSALVDRYDLNSMEVLLTGGAILPANIHQSVKTRFPHLKSLLQIYAMSECMSITSTLPDVGDGEIDMTRASDFKIGCVGSVTPFSQVKIVDEVTGRALGPNQPGVLCVKSPCTMKGYFNKPEETSRVMDKDGWLCTGDVAYYDADNLIYFVEREKELVKYKSHQVAPAALEALLLRHPGVEDAAVVGIPDEDAGELPKAFVVRSSSLAGRDLTKDDLIEYINSRVADYEHLRGGLVFLESIPRNPSGKILRRNLRNC